MKTAALEVKNLSVSYGERKVLRDFNLRVEEGEALLLHGPSGCGKSTLLYAICGLIPDIVQGNLSGKVDIFGVPVKNMDKAARTQYIGVVFQNPETQLFCDSVEDEIAFGLENICLSSAQIHERISEALVLTGLEKYRCISPERLSGGEKQLVILAAVLALRPKLLLLDEALSQLDNKNKSLLTQRLRELKSRETTMVIVDHSMELAGICERSVKLLAVAESG